MSWQPELDELRQRERLAREMGCEAAPDPAAKRAEIDERLNRLRSPFRTAEKFWVEEIIDPRDTRRLLCDFARIAEPLRRPGLSAFPMRP